MSEDRERIEDGLTKLRMRRTSKIAALTKQVEELREALTDAIQTAEACRAFVDIQGDAKIITGRANWKQAAMACHDEISNRPDRWRDALAANDVKE